MWFTSAGTFSFPGPRGSFFYSSIFNTPNDFLDSLKESIYLQKDASGTMLFCVRGFDRSTRPTGRNHMELYFSHKMYARAWREQTLWFYIWIISIIFIDGKGTSTKLQITQVNNEHSCLCTIFLWWRVHTWRVWTETLHENEQPTPVNTIRVWLLLFLYLRPHEQSGLRHMRFHIPVMNKSIGDIPSRCSPFHIKIHALKGINCQGFRPLAGYIDVFP